MTYQPEQNSISAKAFCKFISECANNESKGTTNIAFLMGAGFSTAWNDNSPNSSKLFKFDDKFINDYAEHLVYTKDILTEYMDNKKNIKMLTKFNSNHYEMEALQDVIYSLSMQLKYPAIRKRYMDDNGIVVALNELKVLTQLNFEYLLNNNKKHENSTHGAELSVKKEELPSKDPKQNQKFIFQFFKDLKEVKGIHFDFVTTNYDCFIESIMRELHGKEFYQKTYRGISPLTVNGEASKQSIQEHKVMDTIIKINGGFEIHNIDKTSYCLKYDKQTIEELKKNPPLLIMPSNEQDYTDHYFSSVFPKAVRLLQESKALVIVGYSFPKEDALVKFIIRQFAESLYDVRDKRIFYIRSPFTPDTEKPVEDQKKAADRKKRGMHEDLLNCFHNVYWEFLTDKEENNRIQIGFGFKEWVDQVKNEWKNFNLNT